VKETGMTIGGGQQSEISAHSQDGLTGSLVATMYVRPTQRVSVQSQVQTSLSYLGMSGVAGMA
jgi:hypothetical protein